MNQDTRTGVVATSKESESIPAEREIPASDNVTVITEPQVVLVGRQSMVDAGTAQFLDEHGLEWVSDSENASELLAEAGGRLCYMSFGKGRKSNREYLGNIIASGHGSVLEHAVWNFIFSGVSRSFTHELIRHRAGFGYSQLSQRYVNAANSQFVEPDVIANNPEAHQIWVESIRNSLDSYRKLVRALRGRFGHVESRTLRRKMARQAARSVLPNATETKIFVTANARALRHFIELRGNEHAEPEIRRVATMVLSIMQEEAPNLFGDYKLETLSDGTSQALTEYRKV
jgi:thymidylate synthase (FAD)